MMLAAEGGAEAALLVLPNTTAIDEIEIEIGIGIERGRGRYMSLLMSLFEGRISEK